MITTNKDERNKKAHKPQTSIIISDINFPEKYFPEKFWKFSQEPEKYV